VKLNKKCKGVKTTTQHDWSKSNSNS